MNADTLFLQLCRIVFTYPDNSKIICTSTLNEVILNKNNLTSVDGLVDFLSMKIIPEELFSECDIKIDGFVEDPFFDVNVFYAFVQEGVKTLWRSI